MAINTNRATTTIEVISINERTTLYNEDDINEYFSFETSHKCAISSINSHSMVSEPVSIVTVINTDDLLRSVVTYTKGEICIITTKCFEYTDENDNPWIIL